MNVSIKKKNDVLYDGMKIQQLSEKLRLHPHITELLFSRGINTEEEIIRFLTADVKNLNDPFLMKGMKQAVDRLQFAVKNGEKIVVYGDYDADGVCSSAILALYFKSINSDVMVHIPNRESDGYGLNVSSIEKIVEEFYPDVILTCDCGISGIDEVEHAKDLGVDVIVTDHHEPSARIPDCIVVNPKQPGDDYPDKYLCGAGVALKLVQALCGDDSYHDFLDLAAVATIADLVPLLNENRLITQLGLKKIASGNNNFGLRMLLKSQGLSGNVTSSDIAYKIAPRINAAGRMGDAYRAFELLTATDVNRINEIIAEIETDNVKRKEVCDEIYNEAEIDLAYEDIVNNRAIILSNPEWAKGVTGIAAARFSGDYNRPTFILVDRNEEGVYKGTARGIQGINIFDALTYCSDLLIEYGGHSGAAGFSLYEDNIPAFKKRVNEYMSAQPQEYFLPTVGYDLEVDVRECDKSFLDSMALIEPTGNSNSKPILKITADSVRIAPCKNPQHTSVHVGKLQTYAINFFTRNHNLMGDGKKEIALELTEGLNGGVSGYVRGVSPSELYINDTYALANYLSSLLLAKEKMPEVIEYEEDELCNLMPDTIYGTLFVCADRCSYNRVTAHNCPNFITHDYMFKSEKNNYSGIVVSPSFADNMRLGNYSRIVFVDDVPSDGVLSYLVKRTNAKIYVPKTKSNRIFTGIVSDRAVFAKYYSAIVNNTEAVNNNLIVYFKRLSTLCEGLNANQFVVCFAVFAELGFISLNNNKLSINKDVHKSLNLSSLYSRLVELNK